MSDRHGMDVGEVSKRGDTVSFHVFGPVEKAGRIQVSRIDNLLGMRLGTHVEANSLSVSVPDTHGMRVAVERALRQSRFKSKLDSLNVRFAGTGEPDTALVAAPEESLKTAVTSVPAFAKVGVRAKFVGPPKPPRPRKPRFIYPMRR